MNSLIDSNFKENIETTISEQQIKSQKIINIQLHDGTWVDERFYDYIFIRIKEIVPAMDSHIAYTVRKLCGDTFWLSLGKGERIRGGKCVMDMVQKKRLPLRSVGITKENSQLYQLL